VTVPIEITEAKRIKIVRAMLAVSTQDFANRLQVFPLTICAWEHGRTSPNRDARAKLALIYAKEGIAFLPSGMPVPVSDLNRGGAR